jgi:hypothetical protein
MRPAVTYPIQINGSGAAANAAQTNQYVRWILSLLNCQADTSALDHALPVTFFKSRAAQSKQEKLITFRELADQIQQTDRARKQALPWLKLARFGDKRTPLHPREDGRPGLTGNSLRHDANVVTISGVEGDHDAGTMTIARARDLLAKANIAALLYETPSSTPEKPRWRVLALFSQEQSPASRVKFLARLNGILEGQLAGESFALSQSYLYGNIRGKPSIQIELVEGHYLDLAGELDQGALGKRQTQTAPRKAQGKGTPTSSTPSQVSQVRDESGSGFGFRFMLEQQRDGASFEEAVQAIEADTGQAGEWASRAGDRQLKRAWDNAGKQHERRRAASVSNFENLDDSEDDPPVRAVSTDPSSAPLQTTRSGTLICNVANALTLLRTHPELQRIVEYDELLLQPILQRTIPGGSTIRDPLPFAPRALCDADLTAIQEFLQRRGLVSLAAETTSQAVNLYSRERAFHPIKDYLSTQEWDGTPRLDNWLSYYLGAAQTSYTERIGRWFLIGMVARVMRPGCKMDYMLILEGQQGTSKSAACRILAGAWFSDSLPDLRDIKEAQQHLRGVWLVEMGELDAMDKATDNRVKQFLSKQVDRYRPAYGRLEINAPRQCVFIGTTNKLQYLRDETGGRRFWPVETGEINFEALERDRDQLFAEALQAFRAGEQWWPTREFELENIRPEQDARHEADPWEEPISEWLDAPVRNFEQNAKELRTRVTVTEVAREALNFSLDRIGTREHRRIRNCLTRLGWTRRPSHGKKWYVRPAPSSDNDVRASDCEEATKANDNREGTTFSPDMDDLIG